MWLRQRHLDDPEAAGRGGGVAGLLDEDTLPLVVDYGIGQSAGGLGSEGDVRQRICGASGEIAPA